MWDKIKEQIRKYPRHTMFRRLMRRHTIVEESRREWAVWKWVYTFEMHRNAKYPWDGKLGGRLYDAWGRGQFGHHRRAIMLSDSIHDIFWHPLTQDSESKAQWFLEDIDHYSKESSFTIPNI
jgi:hypothetical protein